jgi:hypothetical protein
VGLLLLLANLLVYWALCRDFRGIYPWIGLALFSLGSAVITAYGRGYMGVEQAEASRYQAFSMLWWITLVGLTGGSVKQVANIIQAKKRPPVLVLRVVAIGFLSINLVALLLGGGCLVLANRAGYHHLVTWQAELQHNEVCVLQYRSAADACLWTYYPDPPQVRIRAAYLEHDHLGIFYGAPPTHHAAFGAAH